MSEKWDIYYLRIAKEISKNSSCMSRKIGTVIVRNNSIIGTGYNGPAAGVKHCNERPSSFYSGIENHASLHISFPEYPENCPRRERGYLSGRGLHLCQAGHSERNALISCAKNGISTLGCTLYCYCGLPCKDCMIEIINAGIDRVVFLKGAVYDNYAMVLLEESKISYLTYDEEKI